jgi:hypothetical protein
VVGGQGAVAPVAASIRQAVGVEATGPKTAPCSWVGKDFARSQGRQPASAPAYRLGAAAMRQASDRDVKPIDLL